MAKQQLSKGGAKVRFIMLEADIPDGDLSQITAAIQNALKPTTIVQQRLNGSSPATVMLAGGNGQMSENAEVIDLEEQEEVPSPPKTSRPARPRKPTTPEVLDLDFSSDLSLVNFAEQHPAETEPEKNLVIAAWFKEHRDTPAVTTAHIYTGYRVIGWSVGFEDFGWPLRYLKKEKLMSSSSRGSYEINHLGLDKVQKLRSGG
ncbi:winged helix-turn-helix domain-containing protein [Mesorhizobium sp. ZC-5]|uniref:winged helix-turn-helix domain-containing protein n=1 Tax=Mesorhizobium sp. ZC-5 TaxID=2986066 RepID=UPI0021E8D810|nr:winged helix-turn-helix domain-containing protein [Mesorhizobium sp. ZC-5]MCV3243012.1 winged helix-turn-helix domain-containing protein [Mesorhizobium sp. ZC-5]